MGRVARRLKEVYRAYELDEDPSLTLLRRGASFVPGVGSETASVVFVGEAPGRTEDRVRQPFVGRSGKVLDELLESVGTSRDKVYITNLVKYRPPGNRDPKDGEIEASVPYLRREIHILSPNVIVPLGRVATAFFAPGRAIRDVAGTVIRNTGFGRPVIPQYHPAVAVYNPKMIDDILERFSTIKEFL